MGCRSCGCSFEGDELFEDARGVGEASMTSRRSRVSLVESSEPLEVVVDPWLQCLVVVVVADVLLLL